MDLENSEDVLQNLKGAACCEALINEFFSLKEQGNKKSITQLLYRKNQLLKNLHESQKQIDCLDYLIFKI